MARGRQTKLLCLVRCGETAWDEDRRLHGVTDLPLSETGRSAVTDASAAAAQTGAIHHPPDEAATETARIIAKAARVKTKVITDLAEPDLGLLEGLSEQVFAERYPKRFKQWQDDPVSLSPPEGEDIVEARARILGAIARIVRRSRGEQVSVVLHTLGLGFARCWLADRPASQLWSTLDDGPRLERYVMTLPMIEMMEEEARAVSAEA